MKTLLTLLLLTLGIQTASADIWDDLAKYKMSDELEPRQTIAVNDLIVSTPASEMGPIEDKLIAIIASKDSTPEAKWFSCRMIQRIGTEKCIPTLSTLLCDVTMSHYARMKLELLKDSKAAGKALLDALDKAPNNLKIGIIGSLGERGDANAVKPISKYTGSDNIALAKAAFQALGKIGGKSALSAIENANIAKNVSSERIAALVKASATIKDPGSIYSGSKAVEGFGLGYVTSDGKPGWKGEFFDNSNFKGTPVLTRTDPSVHFNWGQGSPDPKIKVNDFSVRWTGTLTPPESRAYKFTVHSDDGIRVTLNDKHVFDHLNGGLKDTAAIELDKDTPYKAVVEFREGGGDAIVLVTWDCGSPAKIAAGKQRLCDMAVNAQWEAMLACAEGMNDTATFVKIFKTAKSDDHRGAALRGLVNSNEKIAAGAIVKLLARENSGLREAARTIVSQDGGETLTKAVAGALVKIPEGKRANVIILLGERGDKTALPAVMAQTTSKNKAINEAAISSAALLGDAETAKILLTRANERSSAAVAAMASMTDTGVNAVLLAALNDKAVCKVAAKVLGAREATEAIPALKKLTLTDDKDAQKAAWDALGVLASNADLDDLMTMAIAVQDKSLKRRAEAAMKNVCSREEDKNGFMRIVGAYYDKADDSTKMFILDMAAIAGGREGLVHAQSALASGKKPLYDKAVRSLAAWSNPDAHKDLLELAKNAPEDITRILATRGYINMIAKNNHKEKSVVMMKEAKGIAKRVEEKRLLVAAAAEKNNALALPFIREFATDSDVTTEARLAMINKAHHFFGRREYHQDIVDTLKLIISDSKSEEEMVKSAKHELGKVKK